MDIKSHLAELAEKLRSGYGPVGYDEIQQWPKGRLEELVKMKVLTKGMSGKSMHCNDCQHEDAGCSGIEPTIEKLPTGERGVFFLCLKGGGLKRAPIERLQTYDIVPERLEELGYRTQPLEKFEDKLISLADAGVSLGGIHRANVGRMADRGEIRDNGLKGTERRVSKLSVLEYLETRRLKQKAAGYDRIVPDSEY